MEQQLLISSKGIERILNRLAHQIIEQNRGVSSVEVVGILKKGALLAKEIAKRIGTIEKTAMHVHTLDISAFRDDINVPETYQSCSNIVGSLDGKNVILIDDVLFTGRTARAALDAIVQYGRPKSIQLVCLIDRGHREYPIHPDYVGRYIPTKHKERIVVRGETAFAVYLED